MIGDARPTLIVRGKRFIVSIPDAEDTDPEVLSLSQNKRFWQMFDAAYERGEKEGWIPLEDLD
jgi:hypothetical protein